MLNKCASCLIQWTDTADQRDGLKVTLCSFCGLPRTREEICRRQVDLLENINFNEIPKVFKYVVRLLEDRILKLEARLEQDGGSGFSGTRGEGRSENKPD